MTDFNNGALLWCVPLAYMLACLPIGAGAGTSRTWVFAEAAAFAALVMALTACARQVFTSAQSDTLGQTVRRQSVVAGRLGILATAQ